MEKCNIPLIFLRKKYNKVMLLRRHNKVLRNKINYGEHGIRVKINKNEEKEKWWAEELKDFTYSAATCQRFTQK